MSNSGRNKEAQKELVIRLYHVVLAISYGTNIKNATGKTKISVKQHYD
jgi:hypothetical protein